MLRENFGVGSLLYGRQTLPSYKQHTPTEASVEIYRQNSEMGKLDVATFGRTYRVLFCYKIFLHPILIQLSMMLRK